MKCFIVLAACLVSVASAGHLGGYRTAATYGAPLAAPVHAGPILTGQSSQFREEDSYGNYKFGYDESHATGGSGRREERHGDVVTGSYNLAVQDGRARRVDYISDKYGFRATVSTNEEGVDSSRDPASVLINKQGVAHAVAPIVEAAPLAPLAGPVAYGAPLAAPAPLALPAPLPAAPVYAPAPRAIVAPAPIVEAAPLAIEAPAQAFSYSFGTSHSAPIGYASAPAPLALPAPAPLALPAPAPLALPAHVGYSAQAAPIFQHGLKY